MSMLDLFTESGAQFSPCRRYRYKLWREWDGTKDTIAFCMLNPSTADEIDNDPTVERCERRARAWGYGRLEVVNIFALRSTDPALLYREQDPSGPDNYSAIIETAKRAKIVVCAWGAHGKYLEMGRFVHQWIERHGTGKAHYLKLNKDGTPAHPLYLPYSLIPMRWPEQTVAEAA